MMLLPIFAGLVTLLAISKGQAPLLEDNTDILDVAGETGVNPQSWTDSYSVGDRCYCSTTYDHDIGGVTVSTTIGVLTVREACELLGPGPGIENRPVYNDVQCGNGPANNAGDENTCPGRTDHGEVGCGYIGPKWKFGNSIEVPQPGSQEPVPSPTVAPVQALVEPTPSTASESSLIYLNCGVDDDDYISGDVWSSSFDDTINLSGVGGEYTSDVFKTHRSGQSGFYYTIPGLRGSTAYNVIMGWAENWQGACNVGTRIFDVTVNGQLFVSSLDLASKAGCYNAVVEVQVLETDDDGKFVILFESMANNPMISFLRISTVVPSTEGGEAVDDDTDSDDDTIETEGFMMRFLAFLRKIVSLLLNRATRD